MKNAVFPLFAYPVMIAAQQYEFSESEKEFIADLEMADNEGNSMSKNDRILDSSELSALKSFIEEHLLNYKKNLIRMKDENDIYITQSWANKSHTSDYHPRHKHPNSVISGVIYVDENPDDDLPPIRFYRSHELFPLQFSFDELTDFNASCREFDPVQGMLMLFPSLLEHDVDTNQSDKLRTSISFNSFVRGKIGGRKQLTEVEIS